MFVQSSILGEVEDLEKCKPTQIIQSSILGGVED